MTLENTFDANWNLKEGETRKDEENLVVQILRLDCLR